MTLIERLLAVATYSPDDFDCDRFRRCDQPPESGRRDMRALLVSVETRDEIIAALTALDVVQLQPDDDSPGLWIGFKTADQRDAAMKMFRLEEDKP